MAKELPYFKFEPAEYITKDISFCSYAAQGLFINLCSHYWQRNCEMTLTQANRRFKDENLLNELVNEKIIRIEEDNIIINFLIEQFNEAIELSNKNAKNGAKGGRPKKQTETQKKPTALISQTQTKGIRREEKRKEEIIKEEKRKEKEKPISLILKKIVEDEFGYMVDDDELKHLVFISKKIKKQIQHQKNKEDPFLNSKIEDRDIENAFVKIIENLDDFYKKQFSCKILDNNFTTILNKAVNGKNKPNITEEEFNASIDRHFKN